MYTQLEDCDGMGLTEEGIKEANSLGQPHFCPKCGGAFIAGQGGNTYADPAGYLNGAGLHSEGRC
jgi:hypothetical protein